jgi:hypothetical protein
MGEATIAANTCLASRLGVQAGIEMGLVNDQLALKAEGEDFRVDVQSLG